MTDSGFEDLRREVERFVPLFGVAYVLEPAPRSTKYAPIYCCRLDLGSVALFVCATEEDTIGVTRNLPEAFVNCRIVDAATKPPWSVAIGLPIRWAWEMRNNYGSPDGLQIEFSHPDHGGLVMVQFVASASALSIRTVREIHARGGARAARHQVRGRRMVSGHAFAIVRIDGFDCGDVPAEDRMTVKEIVWNEAEARAEVERLNKLNNDKGCKYILQVTRVERESR